MVEQSPLRKAITVTTVAGLAVEMLAGCIPQKTNAATEPVTGSTGPTPGETTDLPATQTTEATPFVEVTPGLPELTVDELVNNFELKATPGYEDRTFAFEDRDGVTYLVDQYNKVPKAVKNEDGSWRKLDYTNPEDAEIMYKDLVPPDREYIGDMLWSSEGAEGRQVVFSYLGDWEVKQIEFEGKKINIFSIFGGLFDEGGLNISLLALDSSDLEPEHYTNVWCTHEYGVQIPLAGRPIPFPLEEWLHKFRVGEGLGILIHELPAQLPPDLEAEKEYIPGPLYNSAQYYLMRTLYKISPDTYTLSASARQALANNQWPDSIQTLALTDGPAIRRASYDDCKK